VATARRPDTAERILDVAEKLVQVRGFNGFSYADISEVLKIRKASLHHHFASKTDLGVALIDRYHAVFVDALGNIERDERAAPTRLARYAKIYADVLKKNRMCLCGMLAADFDTLPKPMRDRVRRFFDVNEVWLGQVLEAGRADKSLKFAGAPADVAAHLVSALEGAMLIARTHGGSARFETVSRQLLRELARA
jgi:TetR/AcrR family transcriptional repressor of nem operon